MKTKLEMELEITQEIVDAIAEKMIASGDYIPVVRCKDCKWRNEHSLICANDDLYRRIKDCGCYPDFATDPDWFCAYGERREEDAT